MKGNLLNQSKNKESAEGGNSSPRPSDYESSAFSLTQFRVMRV